MSFTVLNRLAHDSLSAALVDEFHDLSEIVDDALRAAGVPDPNCECDGFGEIPTGEIPATMSSPAETTYMPCTNCMEEE